MAQTSNRPAPTANPIAVVGANFLAPAPVDIVITEKSSCFSIGKFTVTDAHGNDIFKFKDNDRTMRDRTVLLDAAGNPILSFQRKILSFLDSWVAFKGDSKDSKDILFNVKPSPFRLSKTSLHVFLAGNVGNDVYDFKVTSRWDSGSCTIYAGDGATVIAKMDTDDANSCLVGNNKFNVSVYPNVDYAFIVALVIILHKINTSYD